MIIPQLSQRQCYYFATLLSSGKIEGYPQLSEFVEAFWAWNAKRTYPAEKYVSWRDVRAFTEQNTEFTQLLRNFYAQTHPDRQLQLL